MTQFAKETLPISLEEEMRRSYLDYAMSVIVGRALPDARDGLKPVHRRVLYAMNEMGNTYNAKYRKSAQAVGETINVGSGQEVTINELTRLVALEVGRPDAEVVHDRPRPGDVPRLVADVSRAKSMLGYEPRVTLAEGLQRLLQWYRDIGVPPEQLLEQEILHNWVSTSGVA